MLCQYARAEAFKKMYAADMGKGRTKIRTQVVNGYIISSANYRILHPAEHTCRKDAVKSETYFRNNGVCRVSMRRSIFSKYQPTLYEP